MNPTTDGDVTDRRRAIRVLRSIGAGALGFVGGALVAIIVQDVAAHALPPGVITTILHATSLPALAAFGAVFAVWLERRPKR